MEVKDLLKKVIGLIERDVDEIAKLAETGKLEHDVAQDLVKYSGALLTLSSNLDAKDKEEEKKIANMSTEELLELTKKFYTE